jgi:Flp pilus assembly protein TadG
MHLRENRRLRLPSFARNVVAAAGINFALAAIPVLGMVGMGIDYMYGIDQRTKLQSAVDSAALAAASAWWAQSLDERKVVAEKFLLANYPDTGAKHACKRARQDHHLRQRLGAGGRRSLGQDHAARPHRP